MSALGVIMYALVALWLAPGSLWRPVAFALLIQWSVGEFVFLQTGDFVPVQFYIPFDIAVIIAVLFLRSHWSDWLIIAPYPLVWWLYTEPETHSQWMALFWIAAGQFILAGPWPQLQRALGSNSHGPLRPISEA